MIKNLRRLLCILSTIFENLLQHPLDLVSFLPKHSVLFIIHPCGEAEIWIRWWRQKQSKNLIKKCDSEASGSVHGDDTPPRLEIPGRRLEFGSALSIRRRMLPELTMRLLSLSGDRRRKRTSRCIHLLSLFIRKFRSRRSFMIPPDSARLVTFQSIDLHRVAWAPPWSLLAGRGFRFQLHRFRKSAGSPCRWSRPTIAIATVIRRPRLLMIVRNMLTRRQFAEFCRSIWIYLLHCRRCTTSIYPVMIFMLLPCAFDNILLLNYNTKWFILLPRPSVIYLIFLSIEQNFNGNCLNMLIEWEKFASLLVNFIVHGVD